MSALACRGVGKIYMIEEEILWEFFECFPKKTHTRE